MVYRRKKIFFWSKIFFPIISYEEEIIYAKSIIKIRVDLSYLLFGLVIKQFNVTFVFS